MENLVAPEVPKVFQPFIEGPSSAYYRCIECVLTQDPYPFRSIVNLLYSTDPDKAYDPLVTAMPKQTMVQVRKAREEDFTWEQQNRDLLTEFNYLRRDPACLGK